MMNITKLGPPARPVSSPGTLSLFVNGQTYTVHVPVEMPLLWVLRDVIGLTGAKYGCGFNICGACTVLIDNVARLTCNMKVADAVGHSIVTVEGLANDAEGKRVQAAWLNAQVPQCGYCQPGFMVEATASLKAGKTGQDLIADLDHICVCGTYARIKSAAMSL
jgi:isoquinoline 1-oxidoreductase alpha subunit